MATLKNSNIYGDVNILGNSDTYNVYTNNSTNSISFGFNVINNGNVLVNEIYGNQNFVFPGYTDASLCWENVGNSVGIISENIDEDSWSVAETTQTWKGFLSKPRFRRTKKLTIDFDAKMENYSGLIPAVMIGIVDGNSNISSYIQTPSNLLYFYETGSVIRVNENGSQTYENSYSNFDYWTSYRIEVMDVGCAFYKRNVLTNSYDVIYNSLLNTQTYLRLLITIYRGKFFLKNLRVYNNKSYTQDFTSPLVTTYNDMIIGGGGDSTFQKINIVNLGSSYTPFSLSVVRYNTDNNTNGSSQRGLFAGGNYSGSYYNVIDYVTISSLGNATDFGDTTHTNYGGGGTSNRTSNRGLNLGGYYPSQNSAIDYVTINSAGNAISFGDLTYPRYQPKSTSNAENNRGVTSGGSAAGTTPQYNIIDYVTINSAGNATDFGDLTYTTNGPGSASNGTSERAIVEGGNTTTSTVYYNYINFFTINTTGNASLFGYLYTSNTLSSTDSNKESNKCVICGGNGSGTTGKEMSYFDISNQSDASYYGELAYGTHNNSLNNS